MFVPGVLACRTSSSSSPRRRPPVSYPLGIPVASTENPNPNGVPGLLCCRTSSSSSPRRRPPVSYPLGIPADISSGFDVEVCDYPPIAAVLALPGLTGAPGSRAGTAGSGAARVATAGGPFRLGSSTGRRGNGEDNDSPVEMRNLFPSSARTLSGVPSTRPKPSSTSNPICPISSTHDINNSFTFENPMDSALDLVHQAAGRSLHTLHIADIRHSCNLRSELTQLKVHDYFDERGGLRLRRLGFTVAAKQYPDIKDTFGSCVEEENIDVANEQRNITARSFFSATQALMKDMSASEKRKQERIESTDEAQKLQSQDVRQRQLEMFFLEVPDFTRYVPPEVKPIDLLPVYVDKEGEILERRALDKVAAHFSDTRWVEGQRMGWMMTQSEVLLLADLASRWSKATRHTNCTVGMDRSTYCRFILDLGLVDQKQVPFYWAVSLFDAGAQPMRCCPPDATWASSAPAALMVNRWTLMSILDTLLRQQYDFQTKNRFFFRLKDIARQKLPRHLLEDLIEENDVPNQMAPPSGKKPQDGAKFSSRSSSREDSPNTESTTVSPRVASPNRERKENSRAVAVSSKRQSAHRLSPPSPRRPGENGRRKVAHHVTVNVGTHEPTQHTQHASTLQHEPPKVKEIPPWMLPPERAAANLDTSLERLARDRLHASMLVEPEVLHLVAQYHVFFQKLHKLYGDDQGHLSFAALLQFTTDFQLTPQLVPSDILKTMYESAQCLEPRPIQESDDRDTAAESTVTELRSLSRASTTSELSPRSDGTRSSSHRKSRASKFLADQSQQVECANSQEQKDKPLTLRESLKKRLLMKNKACNVFRILKNPTHVVEPKEENVKDEEKPNTFRKPKIVPSRFGVGALMETLCKATLVRLGCYGNTAQRSSSAYARIVWMIAYLRYVFEHLRKSADKHTAEGRPVSLQEALRQVLNLGSDAWNVARKHAVVASSDYQLIQAVLQPLPGVGVAKRSRKLTESEIKRRRGRGVTLQPAIPDHWSQVRTAVIAVDFTRRLKNKVGMRREQKKNDGQEPTKHIVKNVEENEEPSDEEPEDESIRQNDRRRIKSSRSDSSSDFSSEEDPYAPKKTGYDRTTFPVNPFEYSAVQKGRRLSAGMAATGKVMKTVEKHDQAVFTLDELFETEAGLPSIVDGLCRLCSKKGGKDRWGDPKCRGCSIVDSLAFQYHPFHALLQDAFGLPKLAPAVAEFPPKIERCNLTPPLLGRLGQKYRDEFGHVG